MTGDQTLEEIVGVMYGMMNVWAIPSMAFIGMGIKVSSPTNKFKEGYFLAGAGVAWLVDDIAEMKIHPTKEEFMGVVTSIKVTNSGVALTITPVPMYTYVYPEEVLDTIQRTFNLEPT